MASLEMRKRPSHRPNRALSPDQFQGVFLLRLENPAHNSNLIPSKSPLPLFPKPGLSSSKGGGNRYQENSLCPLSFSPPRRGRIKRGDSAFFSHLQGDRGGFDSEFSRCQRLEFSNELPRHHIRVRQKKPGLGNPNRASKKHRKY